MEVADTVDLPLHPQFQSTKLRTRPSRLPQKTMRLAHPSPVAHHLPSQRALTQVLTDMVPLLHSQKATTHTTDMVHTTDAAVAAVVAADVEVPGVAAASSDHPPVFPPSCKT
jgi:hypothetical protein